MQIGFEQPLWLVMLAVIVPLVWRMHQQRRLGTSHLQWIQWFIVAAMVLAVGALAQPYWRIHQPVTIAIDMAQRTRKSPWRDREWVENLAAAKLPKGTPMKVAEFAEGELAESIERRQKEGPVWVVTDGYISWPKHVTGQVAVTVVPPGKSDAGIVSARVDEKARELWVEVGASGKIFSELICRGNGKILWRQSIVFEQAGSKWVRGKVEAGVMQLQLVTNDPWPEDDAASVPVMMESVSEPLVISAKRPLRESLAELARVPLVVLQDVYGSDMTQAESETLQQYVEQTGGGLLLLGGQKRWMESVGKLSPLTHENPKRQQLDIWFLIDSSGSMAQLEEPAMTRRDVAMQAVARAMEVLRPDDRVNVMMFSSRVVNYRREMKVADLPLKVESPTGATNPDCMLPELERDLNKNAIVVLLTDGEIPKMDVARWKKLLSTRDAKLMVVAPRQAGKVLGELTSDANWLRAQKAEAWRTILRDIALRATEPGKRRDDATEWKSSGDVVLKGNARMWVEAWIKPMTEVRARADEYAVAAKWHVGLGQVAAVGFVDGSAEAEKLKKQLADEVRAAEGDRRFVLSAERDAAGWNVQIDARDENQWMNGLQLEVRMGDAKTVAKQIAPGRYEVQIPQLGQSFPVFVLLHEGKIAGRLAASVMPMKVWPAVAEKSRVPDEVRRIEVTGGEKWRPTAMGKMGIGKWLWGLAGMCLVAAMAGKTLFVFLPQRHPGTEKA